MRSIFVKTPMVRSPEGSTSWASFNESELARSWLAAVRARISAFGEIMKEWIRFRIYSSMLEGWSPTGTLVRPGRSTRVKSTTFGEKIVNEIGWFDIPLFFPAMLAVCLSISSRTSLKSVNYSPFLCKNSAYSTLFSAILRKLNTKGHLVTIPLPLGRKSLPTIDSITELLPAD